MPKERTDMEIIEDLETRLNNNERLNPDERFVCIDDREWSRTELLTAMKTGSPLGQELLANYRELTRLISGVPN